MRIPAGAVVLSPAEAGLLAVARASVVAHWRRAGIVPPQLERVLDELELVAREHQRARTAVATAEVPAVAASSTADDGTWITARECAELVGLSERGVRDALESGRLAGRKRGRGRGLWVVELGSALAYRDRRRGPEEVCEHEQREAAAG